MKALKALVPGLILLLTTLPAAAATSGLIGTTVDCNSGRALPYAHVVIRARGMSVPERELTSDASGRFKALGLPPALYYVAVHGARYDNAYFGPHGIKLEADDVQHVSVGASNEGSHCLPYYLTHRPLMHDQTTMD